MRFTELMQVHPIITETTLIPKDLQVMVKWKVFGCIELNSVDIFVMNRHSNKYDRYPKLPSQLGEGNINNTPTEFMHLLNIENVENSEVSFKIKITADKTFFNQFKPDPNVLPQTHLVSLRSPELVDINNKLTNRSRLYKIRVLKGAVLISDIDYENIENNF